jgi:hypothetical protein
MPNSITSWESLLSKFYNKFFPMSKVNEYRKEISSFTQEEDEKFSKSWECFKDLLIKCPPHGFEKWRLIQFFYQGLAPNRSMIELMNGGAFLSLTGDLAYDRTNLVLAIERTMVSIAFAQVRVHTHREP